MPTLVIPATPRDSMQGASVFDPSTAPQQVGKTFSLLRTGSREHGGMNMGGRYALPLEFDARRFASAFFAEGNESQAMRRDQPVQGTGYIADGWQVWKYPDEVVDDDGVKQKHDQAGKPFKVSSLDRDGQTHVLHFRPIEVQNQVNEVYGLLSIDNMSAEARGETIAGEDPKKMGSMLTEKHLSQLHESEIAADSEYEQSMGKSTVVASTVPSSGRLTKLPTKLKK